MYVLNRNICTYVPIQKNLRLLQFCKAVTRLYYSCGILCKVDTTLHDDCDKVVK